MAKSNTRVESPLPIDSRCLMQQVLAVHAAHALQVVDCSKPCTDPAPDETRLRLQREAIVHIITKRDCLALFERMLKEVVDDLARRAFRKRTCRLLLRSRSAALLVTTPDGSGLVTYLEM